MPVKHIVHPATGQHFYFGRKKSAISIPHVKFGNYLDKASVPVPPEIADYNGKASNAISQMYGNDRYGNCVEAGIGHLEGVFTSLFGHTVIFTLPQILAMYSRMGGYVIGNPATDQGTDPMVALNYWQRRGFVTSKHKILGFASVNASDPAEYRLAIWLCANLMVCVDLPDDWVSPPPSASGFVFDLAGPPDPQNGHFIVSSAYDASGLTVDTWAMTGSMTDAAVEEYGSAQAGGALYVALSQEIINRATGLAPSGFNAVQLKQDIALLAGD